MRSFLITEASDIVVLVALVAFLCAIFTFAGALTGAF